MSPSFSTLPHLLGWTMIQSLWVGSVLALLLLGLRVLFAKHRPEVRARAAVLGFLFLGLAPALLFLVLSRPTIPTESSLGSSRASIPLQPMGSSDATAKDSMGVSNPRFEPNPSRLLVPVRSRLPRINLRPLVPCLGWFWILGTTAQLLVLLCGAVGVLKLQRIPLRTLPPKLARAAEAAGQKLGFGPAVPIAVSSEVSSPVTLGFFRSRVLIPPTLVRRLDSDQLELVLLHELTHARRADPIVQIIQRIVEAFLFFHPAIWWSSRWLHLERESCCDSTAVRFSPQPHIYVETLLACLDRTRRPAPVTLGMARRELPQRVARILGQEETLMRHAIRVPVFSALGIVFFFLVLCSPNPLASSPIAPEPSPAAGNEPKASPECPGSPHSFPCEGARDSASSSLDCSSCHLVPERAETTLAGPGAPWVDPSSRGSARCTDCHLGTDSPSPTWWSRMKLRGSNPVSAQSCTSCHVGSPHPLSGTEREVSQLSDPIEPKSAESRKRHGAACWRHALPHLIQTLKGGPHLDSKFPTSRTREVRVRPGDTLVRIALRELGDPRWWSALALYNSIEDPNRIQVGQVLHIPEAAVLSALPCTCPGSRTCPTSSNLR